jgi:hypothetical protein
MNTLKATVLALALAAGGCSMLEFKALGGKELLKNAEGHVIGYKERMCDCSSGEELDRVVLFTPRRDEKGRLTAYEERVKGGVVLWDLRGKRFGSRYVDLRSRGTNAYNSGLTIVFVRPRDPERESVTLAQVTIEDIKRYLEITN